MQELPNIGGTLYPFSKSTISEGAYEIDFKGLSGKSYNLLVTGIFPGELFEICSSHSGKSVLISKKENETGQQDLIIRHDSLIGFLSERAGRGLPSRHVSLIYQNKFSFPGKIHGVFSLINGNFLISVIDSNLHYVIVCNQEGKMIKKTEVGTNSWHSQSSIAQAGNGTIMFATYPINGINDKYKFNPCIFRSRDSGLSWEKCFSIEYPEIRHWHTLILLQNNNWLATSGDTPSQSRWFQSNDEGENWTEVTDKTYNYELEPRKSQSIHRTTTMFEKEGQIFSATDDIMGNPLNYFQFLSNNKRKTASILFSANQTNEGPYKITALSQLGLHIRSIIPLQDGILIISEGQNPTFDFQVFFAEWEYLTKPLYLGSFLSNKSNGGTHSKHSLPNNNGLFYSRTRYRSFFDFPVSMLEWKFNNTNTDIESSFLIEHIYKFRSDLWEFENIFGMNKVLFSNNTLQILFDSNISEDAKLYLCGKFINEYTFQLLSTRDLSNYYMSLSSSGKENFEISVIIEQYDSKFITDSVHTYVINNGENNFTGSIDSPYMRIIISIKPKLLSIIEPQVELQLSDLNLTIN